MRDEAHGRRFFGRALRNCLGDDLAGGDVLAKILRHSKRCTYLDVRQSHIDCLHRARLAWRSWDGGRNHLAIGSSDIHGDWSWLANTCARQRL